jgi:dolichol-phosphate mannosyltransferase
MFYFSDRPLRLMMFAGFVAAGMGFVTVLGVVGEKLAGVDILPGWASLTAIALLAFGIQIGCTGLVGLYIGLIFSEVQNRPLYVVRERYDCRAGPAAPEGNIP